MPPHSYRFLRVFQRLRPSVTQFLQHHQESPSIIPQYSCTYLHCDTNYVWWISGILGLTDDLVIYIDKLVLKQRVDLRQISSIPRDIARDINDQPANNLPSVSDKEYSYDPLGRTRRGRINSIPQTKRQLKKARQAKAKLIQQQANKLKN